MSAAVRLGAFVALALATGATGLVACSSPDAGARVDAGGPDRAQFATVLPVLGRRCGSLECHGSPYRNMRLYGFGGLRLPGKAGGDAGFIATPDPQGPEIPLDTEVTASYEAVVGLEPEIMRQVVAAKGAGSDRLTFVRKGRGDEDHKGLKRYCRGDSADVCIQSWLAGGVDADACGRALGVGPGVCAPP